MNCVRPAPGLLPTALKKRFFERTLGRIYVAFGEHPAAGVCVLVCSLKLVVLLLGCFFVCMLIGFVNVFFGLLRHIFVLY